MAENMNSLMGKVLAIHIPNAKKKKKRYLMKTQSTIYAEDTSFTLKKNISRLLQLITMSSICLEQGDISISQPAPL